MLLLLTDDQVFYINFKDISNFIKGVKAWLPSVPGVGVHHVEALYQVPCKPGLILTPLHEHFLNPVHGLYFIAYEGRHNISLIEILYSRKNVMN